MVSDHSFMHPIATPQTDSDSFHGPISDPLASLVSRINKAGPTFIVTGAGNSGRDGTFSAAAPEGGGPDVFSVGAVDIMHTYSVLRPAQLLINHGETRQRITWNPPTWTAWWRSEFPKTISLVALGGNERYGEGCQEMLPNPGLYHDKVVLIRRGGCGFKTKMENLVRAGGKYVLIYNDRPGAAFDLEVRLEGITGAGSLDAETGANLVALLNAGNSLSLELDSNFTSPAIITSQPNTETAGQISSFSTWGPSGEGHFVTTLLAPGGRILSTLPRQRGGWGIQSGSSMAASYITGCIALLKEAFPQHSTRDLANLLASTSAPMPYSDGVGASYTFLASPWQQGAGRVDAYKAFQAKTTLSVTSLAFNDTEFFAGPKSFTLRNMGDTAVTYEISHMPAATILSLSKDEGYGKYIVPFSSAQKDAAATSRFLETVMQDQHATIQLSVQSLTLQPGETRTVDVKLQMGSLTDLAYRCPLYSGYVLLKTRDHIEQPNLVVPYGGIACQMRSIPTLTVKKNTTLLAAATLEEASMANFRSRFEGTQLLQSAGPDTIFRLSKDQELGANHPTTYTSMILPTLQVDLSMYTRVIKYELLPTSQMLGNRVNNGEGIPMFGPEVMSPVGGFGRVETVFQHWTGILPNGSWALPGQYRIRISTLRLYGNPANKDDFRDDFVTDAFQIVYTDSHQLLYQEMINVANSYPTSEPCLEHTIQLASLV